MLDLIRAHAGQYLGKLEKAQRCIEGPSGADWFIPEIFKPEQPAHWHGAFSKRSGAWRSAFLAGFQVTQTHVFSDIPAEDFTQALLSGPKDRGRKPHACLNF